MKRVFKSFMTILAVVSLTFVSCDKGDINEDNKPGTPDTEEPDKPDTPEIKPLSLTASPLTINLSEETSDETAVVFTWTDENEYEKETAYVLTMNLSGRTDVYTLSDITEKSKSFSGKELNDLLTKEWLQDAGKKVTVEAKVASVSENQEIAASAVRYIDVTPYGDIIEYSELALLGTATVDERIKMVRDTENGAVFRYEGVLEAGSVKVICNPDGVSDPDWFIASEADKEIVLGMDLNMTLASSKDSERNDFQWKVTESGKYGVVVNTESNTITFRIISKFYSSIAMVGPATPNGWAASRATALTKNGNVFEWEGELNKGTLRFLCNPLSGVSDEDAWAVDQFIASEANKPVVSGQEEKVVLAALSEPDRGDNMWTVDVPGTWKITLDNDNLTVVFTLVQTKLEKCPDVAMIGPASPGGWDMGKIENLTKDGRLWKWSGHLNTGEIQFLCDRSSNEWGAFRLVPTAAGELVFPADGAKAFDYMPSAEDWKWNIAVAGDYDITIDSETQTVVFLLKESDAYKAGYQNLGLIGGAAPQGWSQEDYSQSTLQKTGNDYIWEGHLNEGDLNIFCDTSLTDWSSPRLTAWDADTEVDPGKQYYMRYKENGNKWQIKVPGQYSVTVNLKNMTIVYRLVQAD